LRAPRRPGACRLPGGGLIPDRGSFTQPRTARLARRDRCRARPCRGALAKGRGRNAGAGRRRIRSGASAGVSVSSSVRPRGSAPRPRTSPPPAGPGSVTPAHPCWRKVGPVWHGRGRRG